MPGELSRALLVPAVDALAAAEQAGAGAVARAVSAVSRLPRPRHIALRWKCGRSASHALNLSISLPHRRDFSLSPKGTQHAIGMPWSSGTDTSQTGRSPVLKTPWATTSQAAPDRKALRAATSLSAEFLERLVRPRMPPCGSSSPGLAPAAPGGAGRRRRCAGIGRRVDARPGRVRPDRDAPPGSPPGRRCGTSCAPRSLPPRRCRLR